MLRCKQGHAPCITSSSKNHGSQLLWAPTSLKVGWAAPACHKMESATPHPGACKISLQYDRRPDERIGVQFWTLNLGGLSRKGAK